MLTEKEAVNERMSERKEGGEDRRHKSQCQEDKESLGRKELIHNAKGFSETL